VINKKEYLLMISQSFDKKISERHQRNLHAWSRRIGEWRVHQYHTTICRSEILPVKFFTNGMIQSVSLSARRTPQALRVW